MDRKYQAVNLTDLELAELMIEYAKKSAELDEIGDVIKKETLRREKTQVVGNIRATYSKGRGRYDYKMTALSHSDFTDDLQNEFTTVETVSSTEWVALCDRLGIAKKDTDYHKTSGPSVSIKVTK